MALPNPAHSSQVHRFDQFELDLRTAELYKEGKRIKLQDQPCEVLALLVERPGELVTREELKKKLWPNDTFVDFDHGVNIAINKLREALGDSAEKPRFIETLPRRGYRWIAPVERVEVGAVSATPLVTSRYRFGRLAAVAAFALFIFVTSLTLWALRRGASRSLASVRSPIRSMAVLPLRNLSGTPEYDFFADSFTDELTTTIARIPSLRVVSSTSVRQFRDTAVPLPQIARQLNVDAVIEGSVVRAGNRVRISTQLVDARTDTHLWAQSYERELGEILEIQDAAALDIAAQVRVTLTPGERGLFEGHRTVVPEAYEAYLKGAYFFGKMTPDDVRTGLRYYQSAIEKSPSYAMAYAGQAHCYNFLSAINEMPSAEAYARAREAAKKAVALDENLGEAHDSLGWVAYLFDWDWDTAEQEFRRAIDLNPNDADAHLGYAHLLLTLGRREESGEEIGKAKELDPLSGSTYHVVVYNQFVMKQYDKALLEVREGLELYPNDLMLHGLLSTIYAEKGQFDRAADEALRGEECAGASRERMAALWGAYRAAGIKGLWQKRIELNKKLGPPYTNAWDIAYDYAMLGDQDEVVYWLEKVYLMRDPKFPGIALNPSFDSFRFDPRFQDLLRRLNLPVVSASTNTRHN